ncbi:MAG: hypothetical protein M3O01_03455 [Pseudomonadota bacterium]|nr:hypothetical protein [Pseudomonadota bacterium]
MTTPPDPTSPDPALPRPPELAPESARDGAQGAAPPRPVPDTVTSPKSAHDAAGPESVAGEEDPGAGLDDDGAISQ